MGGNFIYPTALMYHTVQIDLVMSSTIAKERNPKTSIFGRVYKMENCAWVEHKMATTEKKNFIFTTTNTTKYLVNNVLLTDIPQYIDGLQFSQNDTTGYLVINGVNCGTESPSVTYVVYGNTILPSGTTLAALNNTINGISITTPTNATNLNFSVNMDVPCSPFP
jgi:protein-arginine kinase